MLQHLRFALRLIARDRWLAAVAVLALSLGIGMKAMGFTLTKSGLVRGLPFPDPGKVCMLRWERETGDSTDGSYTELEDSRGRSETFEGLPACWNTAFSTSDGPALPEQADRGRL